MPYPAQITKDELIEKAWQMVAPNGFDRLTLKKLADAVGVQAPSLYNHVRNKAALLKAINELTEQRLFDALLPPLDVPGVPAKERLINSALAHRDFALSHPIQYTLAFTTIDPASRADPDQQVRSVLPVQRVMAEVSGEAMSLTALRGLLALIHGFIMLEINEQLRRGGDLKEAFTQSVEVYLDGWTTYK